MTLLSKLISSRSMSSRSHAISKGFAFAAGLRERGLALALDGVLAIAVRRSGLAADAAAARAATASASGASAVCSRSGSVGLRGSAARHKQHRRE